MKIKKYILMVAVLSILQTLCNEKSFAQIQNTLIPRKLFFKDPDKSSVQLSPEGTRVAYLSNYEGLPQVWLTEVQNPLQSVCISKSKFFPVMAYAWSFDKQYILLVRKGIESQLLSKLRLSDLKEEEINLQLKSKHIQIVGLSPSKADEVIVCVKTAGKSDLYQIKLSDNSAQKITDSEGFSEWYFDGNLTLKIGLKANELAGNSIFLKEKDTWKELIKFSWHISQLSGDPLCGIISLTTDGKTLYFTDNRQYDKALLKSLDLETGKETIIYADTKSDLLRQDACIDLKTGKLQAIVYYFGRLKRHYLDKSLEVDFKVLEKVHRGDIGFSGKSLDDKVWLIRFMNGSPAKYYVYDRSTKKAKFLFSELTASDNYIFAYRKTLSIPTRDGLVLPCNLYLPPNSDLNWDEQPDRPLPTILYVHGGPWIGFTWNNWFINRHLQLLANRGYAVLQVDFRGSLGYGKNFIDLANKEWGGTMLKDLIDIANWAVLNKIAIKNKIGIWGWSYGGYATLAALAFSPGTFACGMSLYGISDLEKFTQLPFADNNLWKQRVGNPQLKEEQLLLHNYSPIQKTDSIRSPLLLSHGGKDEIVPQNQSDWIAEALKKTGKNFIYLLYPDEVHNYEKPESWISFWAVAERFLSQYLGGRFQSYEDDLKNGNFKIINAENLIPELKENSKGN